MRKTATAFCACLLLLAVLAPNADARRRKPAVSVSDVIVTEGVDPVATFTFQLSRNHDQIVWFDYEAIDTNEFIPADFESKSGSIVFYRGERTKQVAIPILDDSMHEPDQSFSLKLIDPVGVRLPDPEGRFTVTNDDPVPTVSIDPLRGPEGGALVFAVTLSNGSEVGTHITLVPQSGEAEAGTDFVPSVFGFSWSDGGFGTGPPQVLDFLSDTDVEGDENFYFVVTEATGTGTGVVATGTIEDDD